MTLYQVYKTYGTQIYIMGTAEVVKETPKFYLLGERSHAFGFAERVDKDFADAHNRTPQQAYAAHVHALQTRLARAQASLAEAEREFAQSLTDLKETQP